MSGKNIDNYKYAGSKKLQLFLLLTFTGILAWMFYRPTADFESTDDYPNLIPMTPQKIISFGGSPSKVDVGMFIRDIPEEDFVRGQFVLDITTWFRFDPTLIPLKQIGKFWFDNAIARYKSKPYTRIEGNKLFASYDMRLSFALKMNYENFPFDDHKLNFSLTNYFLSPSEAIFKSSKSNLIINESAGVAGWKMIEKGIKTGYIEDKMSPHNKRANKLHPRVIFSMDFARSGVRHIVTILIPLILVFFIAMFTLAFDPYGHNKGNVVTIAIASISAIIAQRFIIETMSPKSGSFMISDKFFLLFLVMCCSIFFINIFARSITSFYKNLIAILLYSIALISTIYILSPIF